MPLKTLIVDDEPIARKILREELELISDVEVIGEADNGASALKQITEQHPDLVLLDLQMPEMSGLEVVRNIRHGTRMPVIVIVTAHDKYALQAFDAGAIDYLLKPVRTQRLIEAVERAKRVGAREAVERLAHLQELAGSPSAPRETKIVGKLGEEFYLLSADEVFAFQAEGEIVSIITAKKTFLATQTLKAIDKRLSNLGFRRIHRNALVNLSHVRKMSALSSQRWLLTLTNNQEFVVSKRLGRSVRQILKT